MNLSCILIAAFGVTLALVQGSPNVTKNPKGTRIRESSCVDERTIRYEMRDSSEHTVTCPAEAPYCDSHHGTRCVSYNPRLLKFSCPGEGNFPDMTDPAYFYLCVDGSPARMACPPGLTYNPDEEHCDSKEREPISCKGVTVRKIAVNKKHERVFVVCGNEEPIAMEMCQPGFLFHEEANRCLPTCRGIGNFPIHGQEKRYVECDLQGKALRPVVRECPPFRIFDARSGHCIYENTGNTASEAPVENINTSEAPEENNTVSEAPEENTTVAEAQK